MYIRFKAIILLAVLSLLLSCREEEKVIVTSKNELYVFLDTLEARYENAYSSVQRSLMYQTGLSDTPVPDTGWQEVSKIFLDTSIYNTILEWHNRSGSLADEQLERRLELWYRTCLGGRIFFDPELSSLRQKLNEDYRQNLKKSQSLAVSLRKEKNLSRRRDIYNRFHQQQANLIPEYIYLVKLHNEKVRELGFPNYYSFLLYLEAINEIWLLQTVRSLEEHSRAAHNSSLDGIRKKFRIARPGPWDLDQIYGTYPQLPDRYFPADSMMTDLRRFTSGIGAPIDSLPITIINKKSTSSRCFVISTPSDVRLIAGNRGGMYAYREFLYAFGEAFRAVTTEEQYPILKGYVFIPGAAPVSYHQGVTRAFQEFLDDSLRLASIPGIREKDLREYLEKRSASDLYDTRKLLKEFIIEYELYKDPGQNLDTLASVIYDKYLSDTSAGKSDLRFILTPQHISFNGACHTAILRDLISAQLYEALVNKFGSDSVSTPEAAAWMINSLHRNGEFLEWDDRIRAATGKTAEPGAFLRKLHLEHTNILNDKE